MKFKQSGKLTSLIAETTSSDDAGLIEKIIELDYFELFKHRKKSPQLSYSISCCW